GEARATRDELCAAGVFRQERVAHRGEIELAGPVLGMGDVGVGDDGVLAHDVHPAHSALRFHDFGHHEALPEREGLLRYAPRPRVLRPDLRLLDRPIVGVYERDGADVGRTLHVVLAAHRHHRGSATAANAAGAHAIAG